MSEWPADRVERRPVAALLPYAKNTRLHSPQQVEQIAASMRQWGFTIPMLVDESGEIIAGHGRLLAAKKLGFETVPVMTARGWSPEQIKAYRIADNQLALNASWDAQMLALELADISEEMRTLTGLAETEIARLLGGTLGLTDPDDAPPLPQTPITQAGDLWLCGMHRVLCGDATKAQDVARLLDGIKPNLMVTDPPYGVEYDATWRLKAGINKAHQKRAEGRVSNDERADWRAAWELFPGVVAYVWHGGLHSAEVQTSLTATGFDIRSQIIWSKPSLVIGRGHYHWQHEPCWYAARGTAGWTGDHKQSTIWDIPNMHRTQGNDDDGRTNHSTQKPVECMRRPILNNSSAGQAVYDPFVGSGTTIIAAEMEARQALCIEIDPAYVDVAVKRWEAFTGHKAELLPAQAEVAA